MAADDKALAVSGAMSVTVVTPHGRVAQRAVTSIIAQGAAGEFGVLPGHVPFLTMLTAGVLTLDGPGGRQLWAHGPGFLAVGASGEVEVLVEQTLEAARVDVDEAQSELETADAALKAMTSTTDSHWKSLSAQRAWAQARLSAHRRSL
jgi:F-type H+-transporting ATPase subunit epsilon